MKRVLIVDNSSVVRKVAKRILSGPDKVVAEAESAAQALDACRIEMPDTIVCDQSLSDMTAVEFITAIKEIAGENMPRIYLNLHEMDLVAIMRSKRAGASGFLFKPFNRALLLERFQELDQAA